MQQTVYPERQKIIKILGWYQIVGGAIGVLIFMFQLSTIFQSQPATILIYAALFLLFVYSILCGFFCVTLNPVALTYSMVNQILQLFSFGFYGVVYKYVAGISLSVQLVLTNSIGLNFNLGFSGVSFFINHQLDQSFVNINIVAFAIILQIDKLIKKIKLEQPEIDLIGNDINDEQL